MAILILFTYLREDFTIMDKTSQNLHGNNQSNQLKDSGVTGRERMNVIPEIDAPGERVIYDVNNPRWLSSLLLGRSSSDVPSTDVREAMAPGRVVLGDAYYDSQPTRGPGGNDSGGGDGDRDFSMLSGIAAPPAIQQSVGRTARTASESDLDSGESLQPRPFKCARRETNIIPAIDATEGQVIYDVDNPRWLSSLFLGRSCSDVPSMETTANGRAVLGDAYYDSNPIGTGGNDSGGGDGDRKSSSSSGIEAAAVMQQSKGQTARMASASDLDADADSRESLQLAKEDEESVN
ncbi:uncharacterized protein LOC127248010 [Andrographis paniculata]|uniref:uncharacterized protein LOC127248010 n=1 Tax=Andrographis paniculata TaxID=175694 RepID=UPI0021E840F1|nr:uncharacterized protein LOC127248010 [Andrographis paniculata]